MPSPPTRRPDPLRDAPRCLVAVAGADGPVLGPSVFWSDGAHLWIPGVAGAALPRALRSAGECTVWVAPQPPVPPVADARRGAAGEPRHDGAGAIVSGVARVFGRHDPLGLSLHAPAIGAAMTGLALKYSDDVVGGAWDLLGSAARAGVRGGLGLLLGDRDVPPPGGPTNQPPPDAGMARPVRSVFAGVDLVVSRIGVSGLRGALPPTADTGIAPGLPTAVPADIRRALAGCRRVVVASAEGTPPALVPAVWGAGFALTPAAGTVLPAGAVAVAVGGTVDPAAGSDHDVVLAGDLSEGGRLTPSRVTWWEGGTPITAVLETGAGGVRLPD